MKNFRDRVVVITGAGSGMGRAYALEFAKRGAKLALNDFNAEGLAETISMLPPHLASAVHGSVFDVSSAKDMYDFAAQVKTKLGNAHVIINNAGIEGTGSPAWAIEEQAYKRVMDINLFGVIHGTRAFLPQLMENHEGAIVNVSSIFGLIGIPNHTDYCASKFAVRGFTEALMVEMQESPISVHLVHPGGIATNIVRNNANQTFSQHYLTTPPEDIVRYVIKSMRYKKAKIVYGRDSFKVWLASNLVPLPLLNHIIWREMKKVISLKDYSFQA